MVPVALTDSPFRFTLKVSAIGVKERTRGAIMKKRNIAGAVIVIALFAACIPSVNPFYRDKDVAFDARLLGEWQETGTTDEPEVWKFEKADDRAYKLEVTEKGGKHGQLEAHLFKLKQDYFLDLIPADCNYATNQSDLIAASMYPGHLLVRVTQIEPELKIAFSDFDWLEKYLEAHPKALAHLKNDDRLLLTASTSELQKFVLKHLGDGELFQKPAGMTRRSVASK